MEDPRSIAAQLATVKRAEACLLEAQARHVAQLVEAGGYEAVRAVFGSRHKLAVTRLLEAVAHWRRRLERLQAERPPTGGREEGKGCVG